MPRTPRGGTRTGSIEPDPAEPGGLIFGPIGPGLVSAPLMPVLPPVGIDVPQEGAGFAEDFGLPGAGLQAVQRVRQREAN